MTTSVPSRSAARTVLLVDAGLDTAIAVVCVVAASGSLGERPAWLGPPVLLVLAVVLLGLAAGLLWLARRPEAPALWALAAGNGVSAVVVALWALLGGPAPGLLVVAVLVASGLAVVAAAQAGVARRMAR
jgi:hypothetical protein